jgi:adenylate cyclase
MKSVLNMDRDNSNHPVHKRHLYNRILGWGTYGVILLSVLYKELNILLLSAILLNCLLWPHIAYWLCKSSKYSLRQTIHRVGLIDFFFYGLWCTVISFSIWPTIALVMAFISSSYAIGGIYYFFQGGITFLIGILITGSVIGFEFQPESSILVVSLSIVMMSIYVAYVSNSAYSLSNALRTNKNLLKDKKEKIEALATKLSKYLSPQIYNSIFTGEKDVKIETYRKILTVLFSDIAGFTTTTDHMNEDELSQWLNTYLNDMANITLRYNGTLDKFIGDGVMIFFRDTETNGEKEDALRCVLMAMEMRERAKQLGMDIRIGINTGECTVGNFGSEDRMDYTIIGGNVNLASRLESNSEPGKILISQSTYELVKDSIHCESRGNVRVKGIDRDIMTYWVGKQLKQS